MLRLGLLLCLIFALPARAEDMRFLDWGRLFSNDALGDGHDRWRTGSWTGSLIYGRGWDGRLPARPGQLLEFRLRSEIVAPADLEHPAPDDRRYAGIIGLSLATHYTTGGTEVSLGGELALIGPQTRLDRLQARVHDWRGLPDPAAAVATGLPDDIRAGITVEVARPIRLAEGVTVRPFLEGQGGVETLVRAGGDIVIGGAWDGAVMLRDPVTGQRYTGLQGVSQGLSLSVGGDIAHVGASALLPEGGAAVLRADRERLRMGLAWRGPKAAVFTGLTWLSPEFEAQDEGQIVGSASVSLRF
jgi:hypothetical protein